MKTLDSKKVFVSTPEIRNAVWEKAKKSGYIYWELYSLDAPVSYPFMFFNEETKDIKYSQNFKAFSEHKFEEITAAEILAMDIPEPEEKFYTFQKVLVRRLDNNEWQPAFYKRKHDQYFHITLDGSYQNQCIDYESNKHLEFTTEKP